MYDFLEAGGALSSLRGKVIVGDVGFPRQRILRLVKATGKRAMGYTLAPLDTARVV